MIAKVALSYIFFLWILYLFYLQIKYLVIDNKSLKPTIILSIIIGLFVVVLNDGVIEAFIMPLIPWAIYSLVNLSKSIYLVITENACPKCQIKNRSVSKYCKSCGYSLSTYIAKKQSYIFGVILIIVVALGIFLIAQSKAIKKSRSKSWKPKIFGGKSQF